MPGSSSPPKGVTLFHNADTSVAGGGGGKKGDGVEHGGDGKCIVVWPLRLLALRGKGDEARERVQSSLHYEIK